MPASDDRATPSTEARGEQAEQAEQADQPRRHRRITGLAALTGLAAATAAVGLVAGVLITRPGSAPSTRAAQSPTRTSATAQPGNGSQPGSKLDEVIAPAPSAAVADFGLPRYFVLASQAASWPSGSRAASAAPRRSSW